MELIDFSSDLTDYQQTMYEAVSGNPRILAKAVGQFFVPDGESRNGRFYTKKFWESVISSDTCKSRLNNGMLGTLLHPTDPKMAHPIYSSHVLKRLWIDGKKGMGEAFILDTPIGRIVDTFQASKLVKLYTSSRAQGAYKTERYNGLLMPDENKFNLETFDFVLDPGFMEASPDIKGMMESISECYMDNFKYIDLPKSDKESRAKRLVEDVNIILKAK